MLELKSIRKAYRTGTNVLQVLKGIDLTIGKGELVSIMGSSGSGKSTLLNIIGILDEYDSGEYLLDNMLIKGQSETENAGLRSKVDDLVEFLFGEQLFHPGTVGDVEIQTGKPKAVAA